MRLVLKADTRPTTALDLDALLREAGGPKPAIGPQGREFAAKSGTEAARVPAVSGTAERGVGAGRLGLPVGTRWD